MKNLFYKAALAAALGYAGATTANAQINPNDLVLGFSSQYSGVSQDYLVDLGQVPTTPNTALNVSGFDGVSFGSIFNSALAAGAVNVGIVGGKDASSGDVIFSELDNGTGTSSTAGSGMPPVDTKSALQNGAAVPVGLTLGAVNQAANTSFYYDVAQNPMTAGTSGTSSFTGYVDNPLTTMSSSGDVVLDLWKDSWTLGGVSSWTYDGNVTIGVSGGNLSAVYDVQAVPEPATYAICGGLGMVMLGLRRKLGRKA
jgi:hypothetical protein